jgi:AcrR family transcriptional regulator
MTEGPTQAQNAELVGAKLFAERGYSATTTRELSRTLGITNGTFYHHYVNKEALLVQICKSSLDHIITAVSGAVAHVDQPLRRLEVLIGTHIREVVTSRGKSRGLGRPAFRPV